jgi:hypothetical protein
MSNKNVDELEQYYDGESDEWVDASSVGYPESIGNFLIKFSSFENSIDKWVADGISDRSHHQGYHVLQLLKTSNKIDLLERMTLLMLTHFKPDMRVEFKEIISNMRSLNSFRNKIVHANWISLRNNGDVQTRVSIDKDEGFVQFEKTNITPKIIDQSIDKMENLMESLDGFFERLHE